MEDGISLSKESRTDTSWQDKVSDLTLPETLGNTLHSELICPLFKTSHDQRQAAMTLRN